MEERQKIIGIDVGGTKVQIGLVCEGEIIVEKTIPTSALAPQEQILAEIAHEIEQLIDNETLGIGIGVPGLVDESKGIVYGVKNIPSWKEVYLKQYLEDNFGKPVYVTNDANSFVLGEKLYGKAKDLKNVVGITLGTGFGTGIIINNKLYSGTLSSAGEFGSMPFLDKTIEDYCSGKFFKNWTGITGNLIQLLAEKGQPKALEILEEYGHHLGNAIKMILLALSPEAVFLGGSVCKCYPYFEQAMRKSLESFPFKDVIDKLIVEPSGIDKAAILGAAALVQIKLKNKVSLQKVM